VAALALGAAWPGTVQGQVLDQNFNGVTGAGGGTFLTGSGFMLSDSWDTGITGEDAFAGTAGNTQVDSVAAQGVTNGGVGNTGAGRVTVTNATFNILDEDFNLVTGTGGGVFLAGGATPNTTNFITDWDDGIPGESAFGGTKNGAVLVGSMSVTGVANGGVSSSGAGRLVVNNVTLNGGTWYAGYEWHVGAFPGAAALANGGFEDSPRGAPPTSWTVFNNTIGNVLVETTTPRTGTRVCKFYGNFNGPNEGGIYQDLPAQPGQTWALDGFTRTNSNDTLFGKQNTLVMRIQYYDAANTQLATTEATILSGTSATNIWIDNTPLQAVAPANTARARAVFAFVQPTNQNGSALLDDVAFEVVAGPQPVNLANYNLTASVRGTANGGAGETLGNYQLRIEDPDGDRLVFTGTANGAYQTIGGLLSTAVNANSNGVPTPNAFNPNSASFTVVVAFDNDPASTWGKGGTLDVDNLVLGNSDPADSKWYAGLFWDDLVIGDRCGDLESAMYLHADVKGSVPGGNYALRLEAFDVTSTGINEDGSGATGVDVALLAASGGDLNGPAFNNAANYDPGMPGMNAYAGIDEGSAIFDGYSINARTLTTGGNPGGAAQIEVDGVIYTPPAGWFGGLSWGGQHLASTDLSQVTLSATVKGEAQEFGGLGDYELRIEDAEGDRLYFPKVANGAWQTVGGPLSTATLGPKLGGGGDGVFNLDSPGYTVAISFMNEIASWDFGGILTVDNVFLTAADVGTQIGTVTFLGTANGSFQSVGGLLSQGVSTLQGDLDEPFTSATATGGVEFFNSNGGGSPGGWDEGLTGENAFAGTWGSGSRLGSVRAQACTACGVGNTAAGQLIIQRALASASGGWWAGLSWPNVDPGDLSNLANVELRAQVKGVADTGAGQTLGIIWLRLEDPDLDYIAFQVTANGTFQSIGGPLSGGTPGAAGGGDGILNPFAASYTISLLTVGLDGGWGAGGTITIDNLFLTGTSLSDADAYTVTLTYADEIATWGTGGQLSLDNLVLSPAVNLDGDNDSDLRDFAGFQACFTGSGGSASQACVCADLDGDGDVDMADYNQFRFAFSGPQ
jgi:hypothetical protein